MQNTIFGSKIDPVNWKILAIFPGTNQSYTKEKREKMIRQYQRENVYEALQQRFHYLFEEFENVYVSFSGGKDSGVLLNLLLDFKRKQESP